MSTHRRAVRKLCTTIRGDAPSGRGGIPRAWVVSTTSHYGIVRNLYADFLAYECSVLRATLDEAVATGLIVLGDESEVPEYDHGRGPWRWESGRRGRTVTLTAAGHACVIW